MPLPALSPGADIRSITERVNVLTRQYNRTDAVIPLYAADTGSATAYTIAPIPGIELYAVGQIFAFKAANANSGTTPTLNVNGLGAGTITLSNGSAVAVGDIAANGMTLVEVSATTPTFHLLNPVVSPVTTVPATNSGSTTFLGADVALNNTANWFDGPNTGSIGANGQTWLILAHAAVTNTAGVSFIEIAIYDGTNYLTDIGAQNFAANAITPVSTGVVASLTAATTFTLRARDSISTAGKLLTSGGATAVSNKATKITAVRLT